MHLTNVCIVVNVVVVVVVVHVLIVVEISDEFVVLSTEKLRLCSLRVGRVNFLYVFWRLSNG